MNTKYKVLIDSGLGGRLKALRKEHGWSQAELARMCGVSSPTQSSYENSERAPDASYLRQLGLLGVDLNTLVMGEAAQIKGLSESKMIEVLQCAYGFEREYGELESDDRQILFRWLTKKKLSGQSPGLPELRLVVPQ